MNKFTKVVRVLGFSVITFHCRSKLKTCMNVRFIRYKIFKFSYMLKEFIQCEFIFLFCFKLAILIKYGNFKIIFKITKFKYTSLYFTQIIYLKMIV